jgi:hypothetical protein
MYYTTTSVHNRVTTEPIKSSDNAADILTKQQNASLFHEHRLQINGWYLLNYDARDIPECENTTSRGNTAYFISRTSNTKFPFHMKLPYLLTVTFKFALVQRNVIQNPASVPIFLFSVT